MKQNKLYMDCMPAEQPEDSIPYGKNGVFNHLNNTAFNEPGFAVMSAATPYTLMGKIETGDKPVLFSTDDTNSAVGYFNSATGGYEAILDDNPTHLVNWPVGGSRLGFKKANYITGEAQRNYKNQTVLAFTDKNQFPMYLNCDAPNILGKDDLRLFPFYNSPVISLRDTVGGSLEVGSYYVQTYYERNDGTVSPRSEVSAPQTIAPTDLTQTTDKAILITITGADTTYDWLRVTVISKVQGKTTAVQLVDLVAVTSGTVQVLYTGANLSEDISIQEVLTPSIVYDRVKAIGQLNDALYLGNVRKEAEILDMQPYANLVQLTWISELMDCTAPPEDHRLGRKKSLMHGETYAIYIQYHKTRGGFTQAFTVPGLNGVSGDFAASTESTAGGESVETVLKYQVEDTIPSFSSGSFTGQFGTWRNEHETYPNTVDFDSTALSGRNLRSQKVLHHRTPTLRWCKQNLYSGDTRYGKTHLDLLGIKAANVTIPAEYIGVIDGYRLLYAKRNSANMSVYGQGLLMHASSSRGDVAVATDTVTLYTAGGNWTVDVLHAGSGDYDDNWELSSLRLDSFRVHPFDVLLNKPSIRPWFISSQYKVRRNDLKTQGYLEDGYINQSLDAPQVLLIDYTLGIAPVAPASGSQLRKVKNGSLLAAGVSVGHLVNTGHETCYAGTLGGSNWALANGGVDFRIRGASFTGPQYITDFEESYLINLVSLTQDMYQSFYSQSLVSAGDWRGLTDSTPFWGGDTFLCDYTFHTYGRHDSVDSFGDGIRGIKAIRRCVCESASNIHLRYEIPGNIYSKWYPRTPVSANNPEQCYITNFDRSKDPNQFGYAKDLNALNDFITAVTFWPSREVILDFPFRVHRGGKLSRQSKPRSWRSFLALDYFECQKDKGEIINLAGLDDRLLIHHRNALFRTQDKAKLDGGLLSITLGTGDIFQFEPQEALNTKLGYAGTQHDLACVKTPIGYVFPDARTGELFLLKGELQNLSAGIETFLLNAMKDAGANTYTGDGITIGWDRIYKRILLTVVNGANIFTLSYSVKGGGWSFFHDYQPAMYIHTRDNLYSMARLNNSVFKHNAGLPGQYYGSAKPFFVDVVFKSGAEMILETVNWITDRLATGGANNPFATLTHISAWDSTQHTGRLSTAGLLKDRSLETRRTRGEWVFNDFRDAVKTKGGVFLQDIYHDYLSAGAAMDAAKPWYNREILTDTWFCVRFEFDNQSGDTIILHDTSIQAIKSPR